MPRVLLCLCSIFACICLACNDGKKGNVTEDTDASISDGTSDEEPDGDAIDVDSKRVSRNFVTTNYKGTDAETLTDHCLPNPCQYDGVCTNSPSGYSCRCTGTGHGGANCEIDYCAPNPCQHGGTCTGYTNGSVCDCSGTGYTGSRCETDPCSGDPCGAGFTCARTPRGTASCAARCASQPGGCACGTDADCQTGGSTAVCDPSAHVCVSSCVGVTVGNKAELEALRYCREIKGNLLIQPSADPDTGIKSVNSNDLPFLTSITDGELTIGNLLDPTPMTFSLDTIVTVDGRITISGIIESVSFARLTRCGGLTAGMTHMQSLSLPALTTVNGDVMVGYMDSLTDLALPRINTVTGTVTVSSLCRLLPSALQVLTTAVPEGRYNSIGCCTQSADLCSGSDTSGCNCL